MFAFAVYDEREDVFVVARDHVGIIPLYMGWGKDGSTWSEETKRLAMSTSPINLSAVLSSSSSPFSLTLSSIKIIISICSKYYHQNINSSSRIISSTVL